MKVLFTPKMVATKSEAKVKKVEKKIEKRNNLLASDMILAEQF